MSYRIIESLTLERASGDHLLQRPDTSRFGWRGLLRASVTAARCYGPVPKSEIRVLRAHSRGNRDEVFFSWFKVLQVSIASYYISAFLA